MLVEVAGIYRDIAAHSQRRVSAAQSALRRVQDIAAIGTQTPYQAADSRTWNLLPVASA
jgi:hypothetical protein